MSKAPRKVPEWMKGRGKAVGSALNNIVGSQKGNTKKNRNNLFDDLENTDRRKNTKIKPVNSDVADEVDPFDRFSEFPLVKYDGKIKYLREFYDTAETFDELLKDIEQIKDETLPVSFDLEWTFNYQSGPQPTAVLQLCYDLNQCFVVHMSELKRIPVALSAFINHPKTLLHGVNIKNDLRKLARDFPCFNGDKLVEKCCDLGTFYNSVFNSQEKWSLDRLTAQTIRQRVDKSRHLRMSNWQKSPLTDTQLKYAAIDVFVSTVGLII